MYAVVGCSDCGALWIVEGRPDTTRCRSCGTRHRFDALRRLAETDDRDAAREARAALLAERQDMGEAFDDLDSFAELAARIDEAGVSDAEYLRGSGIDPDAVAAAGEPDSGGGGSRRDVVLAALRELDEPTADEVAEYASARGVPADDAREALDKLARAGEVTERDGRYRLL